MSQKTIKINPDLFSIKSNKKAKTKVVTKRVKPTGNIRPNKLKKQLLNKIKEYQQKNDDNAKYKKTSENDNDDETFESEFEKSMGFLHSLTKKHNKTQKNIDKNKVNISMQIPPELNTNTISPPIPLPLSSINPPYGCLKNGKKPTYREWKNKTQRNAASFNLDDNKMDEAPQPIPSIVTSESDNIYSEVKKISPNQNNENDINTLNKREIKLQEIKDKLQDKDKDQNKNYITKQIKTRKYKIGKRGKKVGILIKDRNTRRRIQHEHTLLKQKSILEVKNYLKKRNLLKVGSTAPNDVIRQIYEQSILCGDVKNLSDDALIHNYINEKTV